MKILIFPLLLSLVAPAAAETLYPFQNARLNGMAGTAYLTEGLPWPGPNAQSTPIPSGTLGTIREAQWDFTLVLENGTVIRLAGVARPWLPLKPQEDRWKDEYNEKWGRVRGLKVKVLCARVKTDLENRQEAWLDRTDGEEALNLWAVREGLGIMEGDNPTLTNSQKSSLKEAQDEAQKNKKGCWKYKVKM
jgi:hypothetical protein